MSKIEDNPATAPQTVEGKGAPTNTPAGKTPARKGGRKAAWTGAAVGIGSAAIVAALLYTNKKKS